MKKKVIFSLIGALLLLGACEAQGSDIPTARPSSTITPTETPVPTREGAPNLDGETISVYHLCNQSGEFSEYYQSRTFAVSDMADHINQNGGIFGAEIDLQEVDSGGDAESAIESYERIKNQQNDIFFLILCDQESEIALAPLLLEDEIPAISIGLASKENYLEGAPLFSINVLPEAQFLFWKKYLTENWEDIKPANALQDIRLTVLSSMNYDSEIDKLFEISDELDFNIVSQRLLDTSIGLNLFDYVYEIRDANANVVLVHEKSGVAAELLNALTLLGLRDRFLVVGTSFAFENNFGDALIEPSISSAFFFSSSTHRWDNTSDASAINLAEEIFTRNDREAQYRNGAYLSGLMAMDLARYALEEAIIADGYSSLSERTMMEALLQVNNVELVNGLGIADFTGTYQAYQSMQVYQIDSENLVPMRVQDFQSVPEIILQEDPE
jgi:hypothetical protein